MAVNLTMNIDQIQIKLLCLFHKCSLSVTGAFTSYEHVLVCFDVAKPEDMILVTRLQVRSDSSWNNILPANESRSVEIF